MEQPKSRQEPFNGEQMLREEITNLRRQLAWYEDVYRDLYGPNPASCERDECGRGAKSGAESGREQEG